MLLFGDTKEEVQILRALAEGIRDGEIITKNLGLSVPVFNQTITMLEIKGLVRGLGANQWTLK